MYTLKEAADAVGMTKPAIFKAIKRGAISANKDERGQWMIDPSELHRVYKPIDKNTPTSTPILQTETTVNTQGLQLEIEILRAERERERRQQEETIADLRIRLDKAEAARQKEAEAREQAADDLRRLTHLLTHQPEPRVEIPQPIQPMPKTPPEKGELWKKLFGRLNGFPEYER